MPPVEGYDRGDYTGGIGPSVWFATQPQDRLRRFHTEDSTLFAWKTSSHPPGPDHDPSRKELSLDTVPKHSLDAFLDLSPSVQRSPLV